MSAIRKKEPCLTYIREGVWKIKARVLVNGAIVQKQKTISGTREQARDLLQQLKREIRDGSSMNCSLTSLKTFNDVLNLYCEKRNITSAPDKSRCKKLCSDLGNIKVDCFPDTFEKYIKILSNSPTEKTGSKPANASINRIIEIVRASFNLCVNLGLLEKNPITKVRFPKLKEIPRDVTLSDIDRQRLLNVIDKEAPHLSYIIRFAFQVPCRKGELINMKKNDLDLINNCIRVRNGTTKNDIGEWKPIPPDMVHYFRAIPSESDYLFYRNVNDHFKPLGDFKRAWNRCLKIAGIKNYHVHDTRHESATALLNNGTPEQVVMQVAGWKTNMLKTYYHRDGVRDLSFVRFRQT